jgi:hypothetical protein
MQALPKLPKDALKSILDEVVKLWGPFDVVPNLLRLPDSLFDVWLRGRKVLNLKYSCIPVGSFQGLMKKLRHHPEISVLHLPEFPFEEAGLFESVDLLNALDGIVDTLPNLSVLGIHGLQLRADHIPVLTSLFGLLRHKLTGLWLSLDDWNFRGFQGEKYLLGAIGKLYKLQMLVFPDWERFFARSSDLLQTLAGAQYTLFVSGKPQKEFMSDVAAVAPNLTILSAPFAAPEDGEKC